MTPQQTNGGYRPSIDEIIGKRLRQQRIKQQMSQKALAHIVGVSYQQIQKYETGANRVSAGRLFKISQILELNVSALFDGLGEAIEEDLGGASRHVIELVRSFSKIEDDKIRASVMSLVRSLADKYDKENAQPAEAPQTDQPQAPSPY